MARKLVLITGMSGSGKTTLAKFFASKSYKLLNMGDVIRNLAKQLDLEPRPSTVGKLAQDIRRKGGESAVAIECVKFLKSKYDGKTVVDGIRSLEEVDTFKAEFDVTLVAVHASPKTRFDRLRRRGRSDDPNDYIQFLIRDRRELGFGLGNAVAMADYMIVNEADIPHLRQEMERLMRFLEKDD